MGTKTPIRCAPGGGSVMIWAAFGYTGQSSIFFLEGRMDSQGYIRLLRDYFAPQMLRCAVNPVIFMQDNASIHTSNATKAWLDAHFPWHRNWPAKSPDLNPIENMWGYLARNVYRDNKQYATVNELKEAIMRCWYEITPEMRHKLIDSMPDRCVRVIAGDGKGIVLHIFEVACNKRGYKGLVKKLYREFMIMGVVSFAITIASEAYNLPDDQCDTNNFNERVHEEVLYSHSYRGLESVEATAGDDHHNVTANLHEAGEYVCNEYTLRYSFILLMLVTMYLCIVLYFSEVYMQRLISVVLRLQDRVIHPENYTDLLHEPHHDDCDDRSDNGRVVSGGGYQVVETNNSVSTSHTSVVRSPRAGNTSSKNSPQQQNVSGKHSSVQLSPSSPRSFKEKAGRVQSGRFTFCPDTLLENLENVNNVNSGGGAKHHRAHNRTMTVRDGQSFFGSSVSLNPQPVSQSNLNFDVDDLVGDIEMNLQAQHQHGLSNSSINEGGMSPRNQHGHLAKQSSTFSTGTYSPHPVKTHIKQKGPQNRRIQYLDCLENLMNLEFDFHKNLAHRMSITSDTGSAGGALSPGGVRRDHLIPVQTPQDPATLQPDNTAANTANNKLVPPTPTHKSSLSGLPSLSILTNLTGGGGAHSTLPPSGHARGASVSGGDQAPHLSATGRANSLRGSVNGDEPVKLFTNKAGSVSSELSGHDLRARFQRIQTLNNDLRETRLSVESELRKEESGSFQPENGFIAAAANVSTRLRSNSKFFATLIPTAARDKERERRGSAEDEEAAAGGGHDHDHTLAGHHGIASPPHVPHRSR
eukprot:gene24789-31167_t